MGRKTRSRPATPSSSSLDTTPGRSGTRPRSYWTSGARPDTEAANRLVSTAFLLTSLVVVMSPGTGVLYTMAAGLSRGTRASVIAAVGCTLGIIPHMVAAVTGLAALLHTSAVAFQVLKYLGVAYLLFIAWRTLKETGALTVDEATPRSATQVIVSAILVNILNPKLTIFFFAF